MPGGDGIDLLTRVKRAPQTKSVPVIVMSADANPDLPQRALALGASDFLHKPLDLEQLLASLKSSLQLTDLGQASAPAADPAPTHAVAAVDCAPNDGPKILVAEDDPFHQRVLEKFLPKWGYQIETAADGNRALEILRSPDAPRLALLDWMMPGMDGPSICRELRHQQTREYTYIILLTARNKKQDLIEGLEAGADDYLVKPFDANELQARLRTGARILQLQRDLLKTQDDLRHEATHDALTQLCNRRFILQQLNHELVRGERETRPTGVLLVDVDNFKLLNDTLGHQAGDVALREVARRLKATVRSYDFVGRYGGEEFLVLAHGCEEQDAMALGERLREAVAGTPIELNGSKLTTTISVGVTTTDLAGRAADALLASADDALYKAKQRGRNRVQVFHMREGSVIPPCALEPAASAQISAQRQQSISALGKIV